MGEGKNETRAAFTEALALSNAADRERYLDQACEGKPSLRQRIEALLRAHEQASHFLEVNGAGEGPVTEVPGAMVGRYKLLEQIGEGGFGVVFLAEQVEPIRRRVALKIVKPGMDTKQVIARFEAERQALALMDHPNIAKVFDAGATDKSRPYFAMELVPGVPLIQFCDANRLTPHERLELFQTVCEAVQHAHQKGIIHRDLKPSNILVTLHDGKPVPKVIDFGTAKALQQPLTERTLFTAFGRLIGTPQYMSPEQAEMSGLDVDTRSDIYSLGVLLYELLTGTTPFEAERLRTVAFEEMMHIIREEEPPTPSTRVSTLGARATEIAKHRQVDAALLRRTLKGDLDWIVMKALEKDRTRRYGTVKELAQDVQRHLNHYPVHACPPSLPYRTRKFIRRNRVAAGIVGSVTVALLLGASVATVGFIRASRERNRAVRAEQLARSSHERAEATLRRLEIRRAREFFAQDQAADGLAVLALLVRQDPSDYAAAEWLMNELTQRTFPLPVMPPMQHEDGVHLAMFSPGGERILTGARNNQARIWSAHTGEPLGPPLGHDPALVRGNGFLDGLHPLHAAFSPDGRRIATGATDNSARIWDATTGQPLTPPLLHSNWVTYVAFSSDSRLLATACKDGSTRLWNAASGAAVGPPLLHTAWVNCVKFSPDGGLLVTASDDTTAQVWEVASGRPVGRALRHGNAVRDANFSPDGRRLVTASADNTARLWDAHTGEPLGPPMQHGHLVVAAGFSPDGTLVATASFDKTARLWDGYDGHAVTGPLPHRDVVRWASFSPDGQRLVTASQDKTARVWDVATGKPLTEPMRHQGMVWSAEFSADGRQVLTASSDRTARLWDVRPGQAIVQTLPHANVVRAVRWSPDGRRLLAEAGGDTRIWDVDTGQPAQPGDPALRYESNVNVARFSPDGQRVVTGQGDGVVRVWDGAGTRALTRRMRHGGPVHDVQFSPDGRLIASGSADATARLWDGARAVPHGRPLRHADAVLAVCFSGDGGVLATASSDKTARLWSVASGQALTPPLRHSDQVVGIQFSRDSRYVVTASKDHTAQIWNAASGSPQGSPLRHRGPVNSAQFSPDGQWVVTASDDDTAQVWESRTGRPVGVSLAHKARVTWATFCPHGKRVLTASDDGTAGLWDAQTGTPLTSLFSHLSFVDHAAFSPDGRRVATASQDRAARVWQVAQAGGVAPAWLAELAEAVAGERLTPEQISEVVPPSEWFRLRQRLSAVTGEDSGMGWARWFLADRSARAMAPGAARTVPEHVQDLLAPLHLLVPHWIMWPDYSSRLVSATRLDPTNALIFAERACLLAQNRFIAEAVRVQHAFTNEARQLPALEWLANRAVALGPDQSMSWTARAFWLALAGQPQAALAACERGSKLASRDPHFWFAWAKLLETGGTFEEWFRAFSNGVAVAEVTVPKPLRTAATFGGIYRMDWGLDERYKAAITRLYLATRFPVPPPPTNCPPRFIDLARVHHREVSYCFDPGSCWLDREPTRLDLRALPQGRTVLGGVEFDIRVVLGWRSNPADWWTNALTAPIKQSAERLHFLHATDLPESEGTLVGAYVIHYTDGQEREVPLVYGRDTLAWLLEDDPAPREQPRVAWRHDAGGGITLQLYRFTWENPRPGAAISHLDLVAKRTLAAPFVVAITAE